MWVGAHQRRRKKISPGDTSATRARVAPSLSLSLLCIVFYVSTHTQLCDRVCACVCSLSSSILSFPFSSSFFFFVIRALLRCSFRSRNMCAAAAAPTRVISSLCDDALVFLVHSVSPLTKRTERQDIHVARLAALAID